MIELSNLTKDYGSHKGVFDLSFTVQEGEVFGFIGPNGAGKTTAIRHLLGFIYPQKGSCSIKGLDCWKQSAQIMKYVGYLPGEIAFFDGMNGMEFLIFMADLRGLHDLKFANQLLDRFELSPNARIKKMSKGMKQKLAIVAAFMHNPEILILDEPTSGLDPLMQKVFNDLIFEEKAKGTTILMSSHNFDEIEKTCSRVGFIKQGELIANEEMITIKHTKKQKYTITFATEQDCRAFASNQKFEIISADSHTAKVAITNNLHEFLQALLAYSIVELQSESGSLEELFMPFYGM